MENASKALIIAGAILLSILIIGLGMFIYQQAAGAMDGVNLDPTKIDAYNRSFEQYAETQSGTSVRSLCDAIRSHNNSNTDDPSLNIDIAYGDNGDPATVAPEDVIAASTVNGVKANIKAGGTYTVKFGYDANSGFIVDCHITQKQ